MDQGEVVVMEVVKAATPEVWGKYIVSLGLYEVWRRHDRCIVTNRKVVRRSGVFSRTEQDIPLERIQDVSSHIGPLTGTVEVSSAGKWVGVSIEVGPLWRKQAQRLAEAIQAQMTQRR